MNIEVARYERLQGMVDVLTQEHPNLSAKNAWRIVDDLAPPKSTPRVAGGQGDGGADVQYVDASGTVVARVEVKAGIENANRFSEHLSYAAQNQAPGGLVVVQVPQGADVGNWLGRFWGRRQNLVQSTAPADVAKMNFYKTTDVTILDSSGKVLLPRQPIYNPPKP